MPEAAEDKKYTYGFKQSDKTKYYVDENGHSGWIDRPSDFGKHKVSIHCDSSVPNTVPYITKRAKITISMQDPKPSYVIHNVDPITVVLDQNKQNLYAYYDSTTNTLAFFRDRYNAYTNNQVIGSKTYFALDETARYSAISSVPWDAFRANITHVFFKEPLFPCDMSYWFSNMPNLSTIYELQNLDTCQVISTRKMFEGDIGLTSLDLSYFDTFRVRDMESMFEGCSNLTELNISTFSFIRVRNMDNMFKGCQKLQTKIILDQVPSSYFNTFVNCSTVSGTYVNVYYNDVELPADIISGSSNNVRILGSHRSVNNNRNTIDVYVEEDAEAADIILRCNDTAYIDDVPDGTAMLLESEGLQGAYSYMTANITSHDMISIYKFYEIYQDVNIDVTLQYFQSYGTYDTEARSLTIFSDYPYIYRDNQIVSEDPEIRTYTNFENSKSFPGWYKHLQDIELIVINTYVCPIRVDGWFGDAVISRSENIDKDILLELTHSIV